MRQTVLGCHAHGFTWACSGPEDSHVLPGSEAVGTAPLARNYRIFVAKHIVGIPRRAIPGQQRSSRIGIAKSLELMQCHRREATNEPSGTERPSRSLRPAVSAVNGLTIEPVMLKLPKRLAGSRYATWPDRRLYGRRPAVIDVVSFPVSCGCNFAVEAGGRHRIGIANAARTTFANVSSGRIYAWPRKVHSTSSIGFGITRSDYLRCRNQRRRWPRRGIAVRGGSARGSVGQPEGKARSDEGSQGGQHRSRQL